MSNLSKAGYVSDIEKDTLENNNFRKVLFTCKKSQLVVMSLQPGEEIGLETHNNIDQFIRVEKGRGKAVLDNEEINVEDDFAIVVPAGVSHNIINTGDVPLKLYTIYSPPEHKDGTIHKTKEDAKHDEHDHYHG